MEALARVDIIQGDVRRLITCHLPRRDDIPVIQYVEEAFEASEYNPYDFEIKKVMLIGCQVDPHTIYKLPDSEKFVLHVYVKRPRKYVRKPTNKVIEIV